MLEDKDIKINENPTDDEMNITDEMLEELSDNRGEER